MAQPWPPWHDVQPKLLARDGSSAARPGGCGTGARPSRSPGNASAWWQVMQRSARRRSATQTCCTPRGQRRGLVGAELSRRPSAGTRPGSSASRARGRSTRRAPVRCTSTTPMTARTGRSSGRVRGVGAFLHLRSSPGCRARLPTASRSSSTARAVAMPTKVSASTNSDDEQEHQVLGAAVARQPHAGGQRAATCRATARRSARPTSRPGRMTPPMKAPLMVNEPSLMVVSVTISCSHRKYHGALAGFGVTSALAGSSSGEAMNTDMMLTTAIVPRVTMAARRVRSGTAFTVVSGASSDRGRDRGRRPAGHAQQRVGLGRAPARRPAAARAAPRGRPGPGRRPCGCATCGRRTARPAGRRQHDDVQHVEADERGLLDCRGRR